MSKVSPRLPEGEIEEVRERMPYGNVAQGDGAEASVRTTRARGDLDRRRSGFHGEVVEALQQGKNAQTVQENSEGTPQAIEGEALRRTARNEARRSGESLIALLVTDRQNSVQRICRQEGSALNPGHSTRTVERRVEAHAGCIPAGQTPRRIALKSVVAWSFSVAKLETSLREKEPTWAGGCDAQDGCIVNVETRRGCVRNSIAQRRRAGGKALARDIPVELEDAGLGGVPVAEGEARRWRQVQEGFACGTCFRYGPVPERALDWPAESCEETGFELPDAEIDCLLADTSEIQKRRTRLPRGEERGIRFPRPPPACEGTRA
jgi:hypothetical protein